MAKIGDFTIKGASGSSYKFEVYPINTNWNEVGAVYAVTRRTSKPDGGGTHDYIYVGQTDNLKERHENHHKATCFRTHSANCLCVHVEANEKRRLAVEEDILNAHSWPCNG